MRFDGRAGTKNWMTDDAQLLRQFAGEGAQVAFAELVRRRIDFVYSTALRQVGGDAHLAQDVTQGVLLALAQSARSLARRPILTGWLYTTTRFLAAKAVRAHHRWRVREQESHAMNEISRQGAPEPEWDRLRPVLDEAMHELSERDREAILLRYFEGRAFAEIGMLCGVAENSARMRVERALDRLRERLARRGITSTAAALGVVLAAQPVIAAPAGLAADVVRASVAGVTAGGAGAALRILEFMSATKLKVGTVCAVVALLGGSAYIANNGRLAAERALAKASELSDRQAREIVALRAEKESQRINAGTTWPTATHQSNPDINATDSNPQMIWRALTDLRKHRVRASMVMLMPPRFQLSEDFASLFALTPSERDTLQLALNNARKQIGELAVANASVSRTADGRVVIDVKPFEQGADIYDKLLDVFAQTLGPERNSAFLALGTSEIESEFHQFGGERRILTLVRNPTIPNNIPPSPPGASVLAVEDSRQSPNLRGNQTHYFASRWAFDERFGPIAKLVPPDF